MTHDGHTQQRPPPETRSAARSGKSPAEAAPATAHQGGTETLDPVETNAAVDDEDGPATAPVEIPLGIVMARILIVSGMGFAGALMIFFLVGGFWLVAGASAGATLLFLFLMFAIERYAEA